MGKLMMVLDTETTTIRECYETAKTEKQQCDISTSLPLVYDIGWTIADIDSADKVVEKNYIVSEIFDNSKDMEVAYYGKKRPLYEKMIADGLVQKVSWATIYRELVADLKECEFVSAFNADFDFNRAIPFTNKYMVKKYYSDDKEWHEWIEKQVEASRKANKCGCLFNSNIATDTFSLGDASCKMVDLWNMACEKFSTSDTFKHFCCEEKRIGRAGLYFGTSAEVVHSFIKNDLDFKESHTALDDANIELGIYKELMKFPLLGTAPFPMHKLGTTHQFLTETRCADTEVNNTIEVMQNYIDNIGKSDRFNSRIKNCIDTLKTLVEFGCADHKNTP